MEKDETLHADGGEPQNTSPSPRPTFDSDQIDELRKRLYSRGPAGSAPMVRHSIPPRIDVVPRQHAPAPSSVAVPVHAPASAPVNISAPVTEEEKFDTLGLVPQANRRNTLRKRIALVGVGFFVIALGVSAIMLFFGGNTVSGENISINASGGPAVGGGEEYEFQVSVANQNNVPIQSATLIIEYPKGTHSAAEPDKEISTERQTLESIDTGELINIPLKVRMYGEENEEKEIKIWIEYRVGGSNATFEKHAEPLRLRVTTSPIIVTFDTVKKMSSGQEIELDLIIESNSPTPLSDILVKVFYPEGFDFTESEPETVSAEDTWLFTNFEPGAKKTITIRGLLTGSEDDVRRFGATVGVPKEDNRNALGSQLGTAHIEIGIEQPALKVEVVINGSPSETVVVNSETKANVEIKYINTLDTTIYDGRVTLTLTGSAVSDYEIRGNDVGTISQNTITWDASEFNNLKEIEPGSKAEFSFALEPFNIDRRTPELKLEVKVEGSRISENRETQPLLGSVMRIIKVEGEPSLSSMTNYSEGPFTNTGPIPPVVGKVTQYTYLLNAKAGVNDLTGAEVTAVLPVGVSWLDLVTSGDTVTYNSTTRTMKWTIGDLSARGEANVGVQVSFLPTKAMENKTPTILETQRFKATDRFTGTTVRTEASALTTSFINDAGSGRVKGD